MAIGQKPLKKILEINEPKLKTSITKIEPNKIITQGYCQEELIENINFSEMVYLLLQGKMPNKKEAKMLNHILISFCDHGVTPPSTQSSRLIASSGSPMNVALAGGLLSFGKQHAGALESSMELFQNVINDLSDFNEKYLFDNLAKDIVDDYLNKGIKIPGFGHRYHSKDPRGSKIVKLAIEEDFIGPHLRLALAIEKELFKRKKIHLNMDGVNGAVLSDMKFPSNLGFGIFMIGRIPGLIAHINEEVTEEEGFRKFCDIEDICYYGEENKSLKG
ncbi:MAG: citryl-CoA lyase [Methanobrevibacter sp.]|nr:citryl-CoA lyase [Methanobrevibacter sp.]